VEDVPDTWHMIMERAMNKKVMLLPGKAFSSRKDQPCSYLRASFSLAPEDKIDEGFARLAQLIKEEKENFKK